MVQKKAINIWDVNVDKVIRPLVLKLSEMSGYVKAFKVKDGSKKKNNKLM